MALESSGINGIIQMEKSHSFTYGENRLPVVGGNMLSAQPVA